MGDLKLRAVVALLAAGLPAAAQDMRLPFFQKGAIRALIFSGRSNHDWRSTTPALRKILVDSGRFDVRVDEEPAGSTAETLAPYDVLVVDYNGPRWGAATEKAVESFVRSGKGLVVFHAASYPFGGQEFLGVPMKLFEPVWPEYRKMVGAYWDARGDPPTGHGPRHLFTVRYTDREHPIAKGLDESFWANDELYHHFRWEAGVQVNVVATAFDDPHFEGTGKDEPILWTVPYGQGRVFHTALGHDVTALMEPGFISSFARGAEWAATGAVAPPRPKPAPKPTRALVVTGGHEYDTSFYSLFEGYEDLVWDHAPSNEEAFRHNLTNRYDVVVLYDYSTELSATGRKNLRAFVEAGKGVVVLHHAICNYNGWPWWWEEVVGGRYLLEPAQGIPASTYKEDEEMRITVAGNHPVTAGVGPMHLTDEAYKGVQTVPGIQVLLTTDDPNSDIPVAWVSPYQKARVVYIGLGHAREAHLYPPYRLLVRNAIRWTAAAAAR
jgi:type 1 glutamine amidotransferase